MPGKIYIFKLAYEPLYYSTLNFTPTFMFILTTHFQLEILNTVEWQYDYECRILGFHSGGYDEFYLVGYNAM
jgi:hypothetical protein